jgi:hypothetical protein
MTGVKLWHREETQGAAYFGDIPKCGRILAVPISVRITDYYIKIIICPLIQCMQRLPFTPFTKMKDNF